LRIISGTYRSKRIAVPASFRARPTTDTAKEGLFNILANYFDFEELTVLDLFAGTGSISLEFASRGARSVELVEIEKSYTDFIQKTLNRLGVEQVRVIRSDAPGFIRNTAGTYDIIFADPPYTMNGIDRLPAEIFEHELLSDDGWFILEHSREHDFSGHPSFFDRRRYGSVYFSFFVNTPESV
jgi:16S rRNA (guanine966-N2)-methyltransferase